MVVLAQQIYVPNDNFLQPYVDWYGLEKDAFKILTYSEKVRRKYLSIEKELRSYFKINSEVKLYFNDNLIGDLNGDQIDDFIILTSKGIFLFKISNGQYFDILIEYNTTDFCNDKYKTEDFEGFLSVFFTNINNGKVRGTREDMYYKERYNEWYFPISSTDFTLQELRLISSNYIN